ncbi:MAG: hypothetical protein LH603_18530 [Pseudonocardia sp.]|nr:hypothetical protein [Pseudonocardia sp.]
MSRPLRSRPNGAAVIGAVVIGVAVGALVLTGCGAAQVAQTAEQVAGVGGANATSGTIAVRDVQIEFREDVEGGSVHPTGGDAPLTMRIINTGDLGDRLISASSPVAETVAIGGDVDVPGGQVLLVDGEPIAPPTAVPGATAVPGTTGPLATPQPATPQPATPQPATPQPALPTTTPPSAALPPATLPTTAAVPTPAPTGAPTGTATAGAPNEATVVLTGLREDIRAGLTYEVVLTFERAGEIRLSVPVGASAEPREVEPAE